MFNSSANAIAVLTNNTQSEQERETAISFLKQNPNAAGINALVSALHDADAGVRWSASVALAELGNAALRPLLVELTSTKKRCQSTTGALHAFHYNADASVRERTAELQAQPERAWRGKRIDGCSSGIHAPTAVARKEIVRG